MVRIRRPRAPQRLRDAQIWLGAWREEYELRGSLTNRLVGRVPILEGVNASDVFGATVVTSILGLLLGGTFFPSQTLAFLGFIWWLLGLVFGFFRWIWRLFGGGEETEPVQTTFAATDPRLILALAVAAALILVLSKGWIAEFFRVNIAILGIGAGIVAIFVFGLLRDGWTGNMVAAALIAGIGAAVGLLKRLGD